MSHSLHPTSLREYDIRGIYGETLAEGDARAIGRTFGTLVRRDGGRTVAVGRVGRESSPGLETALIEGLRASGVDVVRIGLGPTPMLYYAEAELAVDGGIMITGSHNPGHYNGFKMVLRHGAFFATSIACCAASTEDRSGSAGTAATAPPARWSSGW
jgi:phosphomannomutase